MDRAAIVVYLAALVSSIGIGWLFWYGGFEDPSPFGWIPAIALAALVVVARELGELRAFSAASVVFVGGALGALGWAGWALAVGPTALTFGLLATILGEVAALTAAYLVLSDDRIVDHFLDLVR